MRYINFSFKARYATLGNTTNPKQVWWVLHGYGQQAQYFIRKFKALENEDTLIIAPEGLHRFYLKGFDGRVGASWMTREDRETDIENYISYLDAIYESLHLEDAQHILVGFSQGAATASRWINQGNIAFDGFVMHSSVFPPDLAFDLVSKQLMNTKNYFVYGNEDEFLNEEKAQRFIEQLYQLKVDHQVIQFDGKHDIDSDSMKTIQQKFQ